MRKNSYALRALITCVVSFQLASCGTILYPERRDQKAGHLDVGVVLLDSIGLLFFLIPGIIAFAVDFSSGAIYLPAKEKDKNARNGGKYRIVRFDPDHYTTESLEKTISRETGRELHFSDKDLERLKLKSTEDMSFYFSEFRKQSQPRLASAR